MAETMTIGKALNSGLRKAMEDDAHVVLMVEDIGKLGGVFRITDGLQKDFGEDRVIDTPLAESGIVGTAIGLALRGYRPVCEIQFDGFVFPAFGQMVRVALDAAVAASDDSGRGLEVIDLRTVSPLDLSPVYDSVRKTGRLVIVHEAPMSFAIGAEVAAKVAEECFYSLEAPVMRVTGFDVPYPPARIEEEYLPDLDRVLDAVDRTFTF